MLFEYWMIHHNINPIIKKKKINPIIKIHIDLHNFKE